MAKQIDGKNEKAYLCVLGDHADNEALLSHVDLGHRLRVLEHLAFKDEPQAVRRHLCTMRGLNLCLQIHHRVGGLSIDLKHVPLEGLNLDFL